MSAQLSHPDLYDTHQMKYRSGVRPCHHAERELLGVKPRIREGHKHRFTKRLPMPVVYGSIQFLQVNQGRIHLDTRSVTA